MKYILSVCLALFFFSACTDQAEKDVDIIENYLSANGLTADITPEGIYYIIDETGNGENPNPNSTVTVDYTGYLLDGTIFDSNDNIDFGLWQVIPGWTYGIPVFDKGGSGTLLIPSALAYGSNPPGSVIPSNAVLAFDITLIDFQ